MSEAITVKRIDGELYADRWPDESLIEPSVFQYTEPDVVSIQGKVTIRVKNGLAIYDIVGAEHTALKLRLIDSHWEPMP